MNMLNSNLLPILFLTLLAVSLLSSLTLLFPRIPIRYVSTHIGIMSLPVIAALLALFTNKGDISFGPLHFDSLSWLVGGFVLTIGLIVQKYSVRYLFGDRAYRKYFTLLTFTTVADSLAWLSNDLRWLLGAWGATLLGLTLLIKLKKQWHVARNAGSFSGKMFLLSWLTLVVAFLWMNQATGHWQLTQVLADTAINPLPSWEKTSISLLLVLAVVIPAGQWPFHRWLLDSVVAPTPVSAVMHAGIINAGGILLTRFAPLMSGNTAQVVLLIISTISVLIGTGIMLVQADYKRQLVGSTIAQMGFMLIQCSLGAYIPAIIHAVLHGLFKSTLFLQAGSAVTYKKKSPRQVKQNGLSILFKIFGVIMGLLAGTSLWLSGSNEGYQFISAVILGWSVLFSWMQLVGAASGKTERLAGLLMMAAAAIVYVAIHEAFYSMLLESIQQGVPPQPFSVLTAVFLIALLFSTLYGAWLNRNRTSKAYAVIYLWLVRLGEPHPKLVESHPNYLSKSLSKGGPF